ncbi:hypothetical protein ACLKA6_002976 [Drosophila palustris]
MPLGLQKAFEPKATGSNGGSNSRSKENEIFSQTTLLPKIKEESKINVEEDGGFVQQQQHLKHAGEHVSQQQELCPTIVAVLSGGHLIPQPGQQLSPASSSIEQHQRQSRLR